MRFKIKGRFINLCFSLNFLWISWYFAQKSKIMWGALANTFLSSYRLLLQKHSIFNYSLPIKFIAIFTQHRIIIKSFLSQVTPSNSSCKSIAKWKKSHGEEKKPPRWLNLFSSFPPRKEIFPFDIKYLFKIFKIVYKKRRSLCFPRINHSEKSVRDFCGFYHWLLWFPVVSGDFLWFSVISSDF